MNKLKEIYLKIYIRIRNFYWKIKWLIFKLYKFEHEHIWDQNLRCIICELPPWKVELDPKNVYRTGLSSEEIDKMREDK